MNASRFFIFMMVLITNLYGYDEPFVNLGLSSFLDGGPLRPRPGWYVQAIANYYHTNKFTNSDGGSLVKPSPHLDLWALVPEAFYQSDLEILPHSMFGVAAVLPFIVKADVTKNKADITSSGGGVSNFSLGAYLQWKPIYHNDRVVFIHRLEFDAYFPTGKDIPGITINPASKFYYIDPYWAGTLYFTERWAMTWRLFYLWNARNQKSNIQAGQAFHTNFSTEVEVIKNLWLGLNGYYFKQVQDSNLCGKRIPNSKEQVLGLGPGLLYFLPKDFEFFFNLYWETAVRNTTKGFSLVMRIFKEF